MNITVLLLVLLVEAALYGVRHFSKARARGEGNKWQKRRYNKASQQGRRQFRAT